MVLTVTPKTVHPHPVTAFAADLPLATAAPGLQRRWLPKPPVPVP
jgi:hypothetical protein